jgi:hypothetical protein
VPLAEPAPDFEEPAGSSIWLKIDIPVGVKQLLGSSALLLLTAESCFYSISRSTARLGPFHWRFTYLYSNAGLIGRFLQAVVELDGELEKFRSIDQLLETYPLTRCPHLARLCSPFREKERLPSSGLRRIKVVTAAVGFRSNPVMGLLLNLFTPWDYFWALLAERLRRQAARDFPAWLETWFQLEALSSWQT